jgi:hypothetical protein
MNKYKISIKVKKIIPDSYFNTILYNYKHYINTASMCIITKSNNTTIHYLDIYLNDIISLDTFIELSTILSFIKYSTKDNIKLKDVKTNEIIYSLIPIYTKPLTYNKSNLNRSYIKII